MKTYRCKKCNHVFSIDMQDDKYCIACDCKDLELIKSESDEYDD